MGTIGGQSTSDAQKVSWYQITRKFIYRRGRKIYNLYIKLDMYMRRLAGARLNRTFSWRSCSSGRHSGAGPGGDSILAEKGIMRGKSGTNKIVGRLLHQLVRHFGREILEGEADGFFPVAGQFSVETSGRVGTETTVAWNK